MATTVPFSMEGYRKATLLRLAQDADSARATRAIEALERMQAGAYGYCIACGMKMPEASLESRPERRRCSSCAALANVA